MHHSSYQRSPEWIIYHELVLTTREYLREPGKPFSLFLQSRYKASMKPLRSPFCQLMTPLQSRSEGVTKPLVKPLQSRYEAPL